MLYIFKEGKFIRRGSPVGPAESGVYAYTRVCNMFFYTCTAIISVLLLIYNTYSHGERLKCNGIKYLRWKQSLHFVCISHHFLLLRG